MPIDAANSKLELISTDLIDRNPENPRLVFRPGELDDLMESIRVHGIQVPIAVYRDGRRYVLIDGEWRWRCSLKLNRPSIPALIQRKPDPLGNLLLMFNIHSLREQWDLLTIALKLPRVIKLLEHKQARGPTEKEISEQTGLNRSVIRRCKLLMDLPQEYKDLILQELNKPKSQQKLTEDFFIEMERALTTVERALPNLIKSRDNVRRILIKKYKAGVIINKTHFRDLAKIARAERVGYDINEAADELAKVFQDNKYSIEQAYIASVGEAYTERDVGTRIATLITLLEALNASEMDADLREALAALVTKAQQLLRK